MRRILAAWAAALILSGGAAAASELLIVQRCAACHSKTEEGWSRISAQRKTPEGWLMTLHRMRAYHGLEISDAEQADLVAYLSETNGLAPSETAGYRYALEKDPATVEAFEPPMADMCARCHTGARVMLQRRTAADWLLHMDFHVGQFPTIEYQALGRDREWYRLARDEVAPMLGETLPRDTEAWDAWKAAEKPSPAGDWVVLTALPGQGDAWGTLTVTGDASPYEVSGSLALADGTELPVSGRMNLYTGYEWRANLTIGAESYRQVLAVSEDGAGLSGRQFLRDADSLGAPLAGAKADGPPTLLGAVPSAAPAGEEVAIRVVGVEIEALDVDGADVSALAPDAMGALVRMTAADDSLVTLSAADQQATVGLYASVDRLAVEPGFLIARVGGGSDVGPGPVPAMFRAVGFWNGPDGEPGTDDDIRIGALPADWTAGPSDEIAAEMEDARHAGEMGADGIFRPAVAGPNPDRKFSTNNAGDLKITATAAGHSADARLVVTVQRFIDPPIR